MISYKTKSISHYLSTIPTNILCDLCFYIDEDYYHMETIYANQSEALSNIKPCDYSFYGKLLHEYIESSFIGENVVKPTELLAIEQLVTYLDKWIDSVRSRKPIIEKDIRRRYVIGKYNIIVGDTIIDYRLCSEELTGDKLRKVNTVRLLLIEHSLIITRARVLYKNCLKRNTLSFRILVNT